MQQPKSTAGKGQSAGRQPSTSSSGPTRTQLPEDPLPTLPLFRRIDWITFWVVTLATLAGYLYTLAPDLTLEDSGELAIGSMYAGVPHPPGYPVWTLYTWLFTKILWFSNTAWRVAVSSAVAAAFACGICGLLVSRGSSLMIESIDWFKDLSRSSEEKICIISGFVGGMLLGFNGYIWSQAVIVEVYTLSVLSLMAVLACLFRWMYAPHQRKYLYWTFFWFGISFCNHQTLIVAAMGLEIAVAAASPRLGRNAFWFNAICWVSVVLLNLMGVMHTFQDNPAVATIFHTVGFASLVAALWLTYKCNGIAGEWMTGVWCAVFAILGGLFYFYMPLGSMSNPPMNWGYPRTWEGFIHAFTRGQYERTQPTDSLFKLFPQMFMYAEGAAEEFNFANLLIGLLPFLFWNRLGRRERGWLIGLGSIYLCLAGLLLILLNPQTDKQSRELVKVFFTSSHVVIALALGYGLSLIAALIVCRYRESRYWLLIGGAIACALNLYEAARVYHETLFLILRSAALLSVVLSAAFLLLIFANRNRAALAPFLAIFFLIPFDSVLSHWSDNEQRGHLFGYWFGHDMFETKEFKGKDGKPLYPSMTRDAVLFGGTDPGRFCPTYMIFGDSFLQPKDRRDPTFDRRDVALITQNALADPTYLNYIRAHYHRSAQKDPPFLQEMVRGEKNRSMNRTNLLMKWVKPLDNLITGMGDSIEKQRRAGSSLFKPDHFLKFDEFKSKLANSSDPLANYLKQKLGSAAQGNPAALASGLNQLLEAGPLFDAQRFGGVKLTPRTQRFVAQSLPTHNAIRCNRLLLEEAYPGFFTTSEGGLYPDLELIMPTTDDSNRCFQEYMYDAQRRMQAKQLRPGEIVNQTPDGRVSVSGQIAVMSINALLCKVIFEKNPNHEFFIEESFPLDWMFPYLSPFGIIMKINREPVPEITQEVLDRDHEFWSQYSERFTGNWITYETPIAEICEFAKRVYLRRDFTGFKGDPKFVRDDNAQKAFSKLRGAIGGVYAWRVQNSKNPAEQQRCLKEADFAYRQAFAFCPYSPEAVFRYVNMLATLGRLDDALLLAQTAYTFDQDNLSMADLIRNLEAVKASGRVVAAPPGTVPAPVAPVPTSDQLRLTYQTAPTNTTNVLNLALALMNEGKTAEAVPLLDSLTTNTQVAPLVLIAVADAYRRLNLVAKMEPPLVRFAQILSNDSAAWYDLAAIQSVLGKTAPAAQNLAKAFAVNSEQLKRDPKTRDLRQYYPTDTRFESVRKLPEFQNIK